MFPAFILVWLQNLLGHLLREWGQINDVFSEFSLGLSWEKLEWARQGRRRGSCVCVCGGAGGQGLKQTCVPQCWLALCTAHMICVQSFASCGQTWSSSHFSHCSLVWLWCWGGRVQDSVQHHWHSVLQPTQLLVRGHHPGLLVTSFLRNCCLPIAGLGRDYLVCPN